MQLAAQAAASGTQQLACLVDHVDNVAALNVAAGAFGVALRCFVEVDVGQARCGSQPGKEAAILARHVANCENLSFVGIHAYHGLNQHTASYLDRRNVVLGPVIAAVDTTLDELAQVGLGIDHSATPLIVTGGGTGSYRFEAESGRFTEVQPGSFAMMDMDYLRIGWDPGHQAPAPFESALTVLTTVCSRPPRGRWGAARAICDAGSKAIDLVSGTPTLCGAAYRSGGDEHGILELNSASGLGFELGDVVQLRPSHCDPTVNLHDHWVCYRDGIVTDVYPIAGRGPGL